MNFNIWLCKGMYTTSSCGVVVTTFVFQAVRPRVKPWLDLTSLNGKSCVFLGKDVEIEIGQ